MKMANMDFVFDRMFTNPRDAYGVRIHVDEWTSASLAQKLSFVERKTICAMQ